VTAATIMMRMMMLRMTAVTMMRTMKIMMMVGRSNSADMIDDTCLQLICYLNLTHHLQEKKLLIYNTEAPSDFFHPFLSLSVTVT
jgi:hypothetical protein